MDLGTFYRWQGRIYTLENGIMRQVSSAIEKRRRGLADVYLNSVDYTGVAAIDREFSMLRADHLNILAVAAIDLKRLTDEFTSGQLGHYRDKIAIPTAQQVIEFNSGRISEIYDNILLAAPMWLRNLETATKIELMQLLFQGADRQTIFQRIFSTSDTDTSVFRRAITSMRLETTDRVWRTVSTQLSSYYTYVGVATGRRVYKVALARIDERTTDCCLRINGQRRQLSEPYVITGKPRFGTRLQEPPFHWNCRTVSVVEIEGISEWYDRKFMRNEVRRQRAARKRAKNQKQG